MEAQLRELLPFLHDRNPQVRQIALSNLLGHTAKDDPYRSIFFSGTNSGLNRSQDSEIIRDLKLLCSDQVTIAHDAFRALVNLSDSAVLATSLSDESFMTFIVSYILNPQAILADLAAMLLSNLSASASVCSTLLALKVPAIAGWLSPGLYYPIQSRCGSCPAPVSYPSGEPTEVEALPLLVDAFVQSIRVDSNGKDQSQQRKGELHFLATVFANLSMIPTGRAFFLTPRTTAAIRDDGNFEYPLVKLLVFTEHADTIRRGGVISTIKNCAFNSAAHRAMLSPDSVLGYVPPSPLAALGMDILPYILLPLGGPEEFELEDQERLPPALQFLPPTKKREADAVLRLTLVETLILLCTTRWGREHLRENGVYEIVRAMHVVETEDKVSEHIERLVTLLKSDEGREHDVDDNNVPVDSVVESEDEDNRIEEV